VIAGANGPIVAVGQNRVRMSTISGAAVVVAGAAWTSIAGNYPAPVAEQSTSRLLTTAGPVTDRRRTRAAAAGPVAGAARAVRGQHRVPISGENKSAPIDLSKLTDPELEFLIGLVAKLTEAEAASRSSVGDLDSTDHKTRH
jgi:hypothetical protein